MKNLVFIFFALFLFFACTEAPKNTPISEAPKEVVSDSMAIAYTIHGFTNGIMSFRWTPLFYG